MQTTEKNALLDAALAYADKGLPVFPCNPKTKTPLVPHGFKDASLDREQIGAWWQKWPDAMIGMPTGERTGFWALDIDDPAAFEAACRLDLPRTRRCDTGKGYHLLFKHDARLSIRNQQRHPKTGWPFPDLPGAETRADGGYVIVPPSIHPSGKQYRWHDDATVTAAPPSLVKLLTKPRERSAPPPPGASLRDRVTGGSAYGLAALKAECEAIAAAGDGEQEAALNEAALKVGALVAGGELGRASAREALLEAGLAMPSFDPGNPWTTQGIERKIDAGLQAGARRPRSAPERGGVKLGDFRAYMPTHTYIFAPSGEFWPGGSVNSRIPPVPLLDASGDPVLDDKNKPKTITASQWLDQNQPVEQMTWAPGEPQIIPDRLISDGGWIERASCHVFNLYRPPLPLKGDATKAQPWLDHIRRIYPDDAEHIVHWLAHRVQRPQEKINHAIVLGGPQGIGKDTLLDPVKDAIGPWNFAEVSPQHMLGRFNGFVKSVILRVSEARDLGDVDRFAFYDHLKTYTAAPPDVLRVDEKHVREYTVFNVCGLIITTNHKSDGIFLPADDRRHYVAWSDHGREDFPAGYWNKLHDWYGKGGRGHVGEYLRTLPLDRFDPKEPPPKTPAFWDIVSANQAPEEAELADALEILAWPAAVTVAVVADAASNAFREFLLDRRNSRRIPHRFEECGYVQVRNDTAKDGYFKVGPRRCPIYAKKSLSRREQIAAAELLARR